MNTHQMHLRGVSVSAANYNKNKGFNQLNNFAKSKVNAKRYSTGFTLIEVIIVIVILGILGTISISDFILFKKKSDLDNNVQEFVGVLKFSQNRTLASEQDSQYGVYLDTAVSPNKYTLFKGASFASRDTSFDQTYFLSDTIEFSNIDLGGNSEIVFNKLTGSSQVSGSITLRLKLDTSQAKTVYISSPGIIGFNSPVVPSDDSRLKDSRHLHFDYSRVIDTANENITLSFDNGAVVRTFPISAYLISGQIELSDTALVGGTNQTVQIHTHRLNSSDTQFSIHRDRRINDKSLIITISGNSSGNLAQYSADGLTTNFSSIYVSNFVWQ